MDEKVQWFIDLPPDRRTEPDLESARRLAELSEEQRLVLVDHYLDLDLPRVAGQFGCGEAVMQYVFRKMRNAESGKR